MTQHEQAAARGCYILTALADDGELRGEAYRTTPEEMKAEASTAP